ncbi:hypothetical protein F5Y08DRAFT_349225 [Xylaria arbuscula]|nr:hypothetical protein F5Y08DRAFT_349225 [Xylaria arbuscula]
MNDLEPIAVVGSSCRFPGGATSPSKLWDLLKSPRDVLKEIPASRFNAAAFYHQNPERHGSTNVQHSYLLDADYRHFDYSFFSISPREAESMDPQQRLLLETVYEVVESAGYSINQLRRSSTAVFVGQMGYSAPQYLATGISTAIMSNRVSYFFDWNGPSVTIDTACSSSLVAVHQAVQSLRSGESSLAVAGGVNLLLGPEEYIFESNLHMLSSTGRCRMWDADVDGYGRGEGFAALLLKPLRQAIADNDHIECVIRNTGVNQDGRTKGITMPNATAQAALIKSTYERCGLALDRADDRPQYFEAHGTGTPAGDPIEAEAIQTAFFPDGSSPFDRKLFVGSIKTIIGHLEGSAGLAGVLKVSLAMQNGIIPPNMHLNELNPRVRPFYDNLQIPTRAITWPSLPRGVPKRASVNSFGFGGTNAHAIIESWEPDMSRRESLFRISTAGPFVMSASSATSLVSSFRELYNFLQSQENTNLADLEYTLSRRSEFQWKASFSANNKEQLMEKLDRAVTGASVATRATPVTARLPPRILGVFTGQGAQWPAMGAHLYAHSKVFRNTINILENALKTMTDPPSWSLSGELVASGANSQVHKAAISQPLCTALQIALVDLLATAGISFSAVVGHSSGEIAASYAAKHLSAEDAIRIAYLRGVYAHMAQGRQGQEGSMMAVGMSFEEAERFCRSYGGRIVVAASNARTSVTLSGDSDGIDEAKRLLDERKIFSRTLKVDTAYHSHHMDPCAGPYLESLRRCNIEIVKGPSACNWYSSVYGSNGRSIRDLDALKGEYWVKNMTQTVLYSQAVHRAVTEEHCFDIVLEVGPHPALQGPTMEILRSLTRTDIPYSGTLKRGEDDMIAISDAVGFLWKNFSSTTPFTNLEGLRGSFCNGDKEQRRSILKGLPSYCWDHDKIMLRESRKSKAFRTRREPMHELLGTSTSHYSGHFEREVKWHQIIRLDELGWLRGHCVQNQVLFPAAAYVAMAFEASVRLADKQPLHMVELLDLAFHRAVTLVENSNGTKFDFIIRVVDRRKDQISAEYSCYSCDADASSGSEFLSFTGKALLTFGAHTYPPLPTRSEHGLPMMPVDVNEFYSHIAELGLDYSGGFRVKSIRRRLNRSTVTTSSIDTNLRVHPMSLDAAFHSLFAACSWPGDGTIWTTYLPTSIQLVRINVASPDTIDALDHVTPELLADCNVTSVDEKSISGNINIFRAGDGHPEMQIHQFTCSSFSQSRPEDDRQLYAKTVWARDIPQGVDDQRIIAHSSESSRDTARLVELCERAAFFYCRELQKSVRPEEQESMDWHMSHLTHWIFDHLLPTIQAGKHPHIKREWENDTQEMVAQWISDNPESIDLESIGVIGKILLSVVRGTMSTLQVMMEKGLIHRVYIEGIGFQEGNRDLSIVVSQIAHRHPCMNILEIGAGTGGATSSILKSLSHKFLSYTYTDISAGFFEAATKIFEEYEEYEESMIFKRLDISKDPSAQGFDDHSYDLIIASNVLHATVSLAQTMRNCRQLLKPGGYLAMLEITGDHLRPQFIASTLKGWFMGVDDGRIWAPTISEAQWDTVLREAGFSGVDVSLNSGFSVMATQAVDERVVALRSPLVPSSSNHAPLSHIEELVIFGGQTTQTVRLANDIKGLLTSHASRITCIPGLNDLNDGFPETIPVGATVLCLIDLEKPVFSDMNEGSFTALQNMFRSAKHILWVTQGCRDKVPEANMIVGLGRSLLQESPHLQLQFFDISPNDAPSPALLSEYLLRLVYLSRPEFQGVHWTAEHELVMENGVIYTPRFISNQPLNDRLNSTRRTIKQEVEIDETYAIELICSDTGGVSAEPLNGWTRHCNSSDKGEVCAVKFSSALPFILANGQSVFFCAGELPKDKRQALVMSKRRCSRLDVIRGEVLGYIDNEDGAACLERFLLDILTENVFRVTAGSVWIHEPYKPLIPTLKSAAARNRVSAILTTSVCDSDSRLHFIHPCITPDDLEHFVPAEVTAYMDMQPDIRPKLDERLVKSSLKNSARILDFFVYPQKQKSLNLHFDRDQLRGIANVSLNQVDRGLSPGTDIVPIHHIINQSSADWHPTTIIKWTASEAIPLRIKPLDHRGLFSAYKTYMLVGLTGDLGLSICQWMADNGARHLVIASRNPKVDPNTLKLLERRGAKLLVVALDISDKSDLEKAYREISTTMPPVGGVANGAMVLQDKLFDNMTWADFEKVLLPKVQGSRNLDELFHSTKLEFFILFSSMASVVGNKGQSNYGAANMYMTSLARQRRQRGLAASVIHIGMLVSVGYVSRSGHQIQNRLAKHGVTTLSETDFHSVLAEAILTGRTGSDEEVEIFTGLGKDTEAPWALQPRFSTYFKSAGTLKRQTQQGSGDFRNTLAATGSEDEVMDKLISEFSRALQNLLQISADKIDKQSPLTNLGIDSLVAVQVRTWFLKELNVDIPVLRILSDASIEDLCKDAFARLRVDGNAIASEPKAPQANTAAVKIDWDREIESLFDNHKTPIAVAPLNGVDGTSAKDGLCIVLTGATGFVGTHILRRLVEDLRVSEIHCIAIRPDSHGVARHVSVQSPKVFEYSGDLTNERFGLSEPEYHGLARKADAIIHNAAEVSLLKSYSALKSINVVSTARLAQLALARSIRIHLVSTGGISLFAKDKQLPEISPRDFPPVTDGSLGYAASKWVSEVLLELFAERCQLPVFIHRAVVILGEGAPDMDFMTVAHKYSPRLRALPQLGDGLMDGALDMIEVDQLVEGMTRTVLGTACMPEKYHVLNYCNEEKFMASEFPDHYEKRTGSRYPEIPADLWLDRAVALGLNPKVDFYFREFIKSGRPIPIPSLRRGLK